MIIAVRSIAVRFWGSEADNEGDYEDDGVVDGGDNTNDGDFLEDGDIFLEDKDEHESNSAQVDDYAN